MTNFSFLKQDNCSQRIVEKEFTQIKTEIKTEIKVEQEESYANFETPQFNLFDQDQTGIKSEQAEAHAQFEAPELKIEDLQYMMQGNEGPDIKGGNNDQRIEIKTESEILVMQQGNLVPLKIEVKEEPLNYGDERQNYLNFENVQLESQNLQSYDSSVIKPNSLKVMNSNIHSQVELTSESKSSLIHKTDPTSKETVYQCGLCKQVKFRTKPELQFHFDSCTLRMQEVRSEPFYEDRPTAFECGRCKFRAGNKRLMSEHWITDWS